MLHRLTSPRSPVHPKALVGLGGADTADVDHREGLAGRAPAKYTRHTHQTHVRQDRAVVRGNHRSKSGGSGRDGQGGRGGDVCLCVAMAVRGLGLYACVCVGVCVCVCVWCAVEMLVSPHLLNPPVTAAVSAAGATTLTCTSRLMLSRVWSQVNLTRQVGERAGKGRVTKE